MAGVRNATAEWRNIETGNGSYNRADYNRGQIKTALHGSGLTPRSGGPRSAIHMGLECSLAAPNVSLNCPNHLEGGRSHETHSRPIAVRLAELLLNSRSSNRR